MFSNPLDYKLDKEKKIIEFSQRQTFPCYELWLKKREKSIKEEINHLLYDNEFLSRKKQRQKSRGPRGKQPLIDYDVKIKYNLLLIKKLEGEISRGFTEKDYQRAKNRFFQKNRRMARRKLEDLSEITSANPSKWPDFYHPSRGSGSSPIKK